MKKTLVIIALITQLSGIQKTQTQVCLFRDGQLVRAGREVVVETANQVDLKRLAANPAWFLT